MGVGQLARARDRLLAADAEERSLGELCTEVVAAMHEVTRFDWCAVMTTDSDTHLPTGGVVEGFDASACAPFWDNELVDPDFLKFNDLARSVVPMGTLHEALDGDLHRSPRFAKLYSSLGAADELRMAFTAGSTCLAVGVFVRAGHDGVFTAEELVDVGALLPIASAVLRRAQGRVAQSTSARHPVVLILDAAGEIRSATAGASAVLDELRAEGLDEPGVPATIRAAATRARWSRSTSSFATRIRGRDGHWSRLHVAPMEDPDGSVAVTIEQARPGDLVPIMLESYGLTDRETEVVLLLARGLSAKEIADELLISSHTVRDHVKAVYEKAGVNGKGELVARLFSDHVLDTLHRVVTHIA